MKIMSVNLNGIRAAEKKGFFEWMVQQDADVVCVQETKAQDDILEQAIFRPAGYHAVFHSAEKKGYSGVGIYSKQAPDAIHTGLGFETADTEGRYIQADFGDLSIASLYLPSGTSGDERQAIKYDFLDRYYDDHLKPALDEQRSMIICGDWNIAHQERDLRNWKGNKKNSGFLPEERAWLDKIYDDGWVDAFRVLDQPEHEYTWWSYRGQARAKNVGWRIDLQVITPDLKDSVIATEIFREPVFSDHAPLLIQYDRTL